MPLEVEVELQDAALEAALEAALVRVLPLVVDDLEGNLLREVGAKGVGGQIEGAWKGARQRAWTAGARTS